MQQTVLLNKPAKIASALPQCLLVHIWYGPRNHQQAHVSSGTAKSGSYFLFTHENRSGRDVIDATVESFLPRLIKGKLCENKNTHMLIVCLVTICNELKYV